METSFYCPVSIFFSQRLVSNPRDLNFLGAGDTSHVLELHAEGIWMSLFLLGCHVTEHLIFTMAETLATSQEGPLHTSQTSAEVIKATGSGSLLGIFKARQ
jgi:hypothetical protein